MPAAKRSSANSQRRLGVPVERWPELQPGARLGGRMDGLDMDPNDATPVLQTVPALAAAPIR